MQKLVAAVYTAGVNYPHTTSTRYVNPVTGDVWHNEDGTGSVAAANHYPVTDKPGVFQTRSGASELSALVVATQETKLNCDGGQKFDSDKDEPSLLMQGCALAVQGVIAVLGFGFRKYGKRNGWKEVPEAPRRYKDALYRHLAAIERGELIDPESGKPHWDHVACNAMFESQMHHEGGSYVAG